jgi:hypothetical protein
MTLTYPHDRPQPHPASIEAVRPEPFVPVYARDRRSLRSRKSGVKTWMILAPVAVLVLGGSAALLMMGERDNAAPAPLAEPAATAPVLPAQPLLTETAPVEIAPVAEATPAPAPLVRRTAPAPARRSAAPVRASTPAPAPAARVVAPAEPTGPQPYTATLNTTPAQAPAPVIVIQPAD